jgi:hypothetical protein
MKHIIIYTLLFAILLQAVGCYSFYPLERDKIIKDYTNSSNHLEFELKNGDHIQAISKECRFIDKPGKYIIGKGTLIDKKTQDEEVFEGEVNIESVDSVKNIVADSKKYVFCYLKNLKKIIFEENNIVMMTTETVSDFWVIYNRPPKIIYSSDIKDIQIEKMTTTGIIIIVTLVGAFIVLLVIVGPYSGPGDMSGLGQIFSGWR